MQFKNDYFFLSNFYVCNIELELGGKICKFTNSEAAFQAQKNLEVADKFALIKPLQAKKLGNDLVITTPNWDTYRLIAMGKALQAKFSQNKGLLVALRCVKDEIVEDNYWHDTFWGRCKGEGKNMLGKMLMFIRDHGTDWATLSFYIENTLIPESLL